MQGTKILPIGSPKVDTNTLLKTVIASHELLDGESDKLKKAVTRLQKFFRTPTPIWIKEPQFDQYGNTIIDGIPNEKIYQFQDENQHEFWDEIQEINFSTSKILQMIVYIRSALYPSEYQNMESPDSSFFNYLQQGFKKDNPQLAQDQGEEKKGVLQKFGKKKMNSAKSIDTQSPYRIENRKLKKIEKKVELYDLVIEYHDRGYNVWADEILTGDLTGQRNYMKIYSSVFNSRFIQALERSIGYIDSLMKNNEKLLTSHIIMGSMNYEQKALGDFPPQADPSLPSKPSE